MKTNLDQSFLGRGWGFPPTFRQDLPGVEMLEGLEDVKSSLHIIISTITGERVMQPSFGCNLMPFVFESMTVPTLSMMQKIVREALTLHEPRIQVDDVRTTVFQEEGKVSIEVEFTLITTNTRYNYVYPFYYTEATNLVK
jgi:phage baseplate assembly protein W